MFGAREELKETILSLRNVEGMETPYTFTDEDARELGFLIDQLDRVHEKLELEKES